MSGGVELESDVLLAAVGMLRASAETVVAGGRRIDGCRFGAQCAGRDYGRHGDALQDGYGRLGRSLVVWAQGTRAWADALARTAESFVAQEAANTAVLNRRTPPC